MTYVLNPKEKSNFAEESSLAADSLASAPKSPTPTPSMTDETSLGVDDNPPDKRKRLRPKQYDSSYEDALRRELEAEERKSRLQRHLNSRRKSSRISINAIIEIQPPTIEDCKCVVTRDLQFFFLEIKLHIIVIKWNIIFIKDVEYHFPTLVIVI